MVQVLVLLALALLVSAFARRRGWSAPLLLVLVGLVVSFVPGVPTYELDPDLVLLVFLPPLLYAAAWESSYLNLRQNLQAVALLSVGLVLFTAFAVGYVMNALVPGLGLAAALALGAIVAPPDAVAATAIGREVGLPRRLITILAGESLVNDATALVAYRTVIIAAAAGTFVLGNAVAGFVAAAVGGIGSSHFSRRAVTRKVKPTAKAIRVVGQMSSPRLVSSSAKALRAEEEGLRASPSPPPHCSSSCRIVTSLKSCVREYCSAKRL